MNAQRRKDIQAIIDRMADLEELKADLYSMIETVRDEEQEYYDNMPEGLQVSDRGYAAEEAVSQLDEAKNMLDDLDIDTLRGCLETAAE